MEEPQNPLPPFLSPSSSGRRITSANSPEFEFWMARPEPELPSADQLFSHGFLLPLHNLHLSNDPPLQPEPEPAHDPAQPEPESSTPEISSTSSKRWRDIFKKTDTTNNNTNTNQKDNNTPKEKKREKKKVNGATNGVNAGAELNINIWPFSRSRSAGNRPRSSSSNVARKVSSAPCSRSNSSGESKSKKWPGSPNRGVHLGKTSPVWQLKVAGKNETRRKISSAGAGVGGGSKVKVLSLNVPMCMGYREHLSCRGFESSAGEVNAGGQRGVEGEGVRVSGSGSGSGSGSNFFNIRGLFGKKVY